MQDAREKIFQQDIVSHLVSHGWKLGAAEQAIGCLMKELRTALSTQVCGARRA